MNREELGKILYQVSLEHCNEINCVCTQEERPTFEELPEPVKELSMRMAERLYKLGFEVGLNFTVTNRHN